MPETMPTQSYNKQRGQSIKKNIPHVAVSARSGLPTWWASLPIKLAVETEYEKGEGL